MKQTVLSKSLSAFPLAFFLVATGGFAQEPKIFRVSDFDLSGKVKSCLVLTDYGREEFAFDTLGLLTKSVTRYNETDYDVTYYRYEADRLKERRDEKYRDGVIDKQTSIAHFYELDTATARRVTETIISYSQEVLDQYQYYYGDEGGLERIIRSNQQGVDETVISHSRYKDQHTITYTLNGDVEKSVREHQQVTREGDTLRIVLEKNFVDGTGTRASEKKYNTRGQLVEEQEFVYNPRKQSFEPSALFTYFYDDRDALVKVEKKERNTTSVKEHIYQYDRPEGGNWVKKITTPDNEYITRKITYYPQELDVSPPE